MCVIIIKLLTIVIIIIVMHTLICNHRNYLPYYIIVLRMRKKIKLGRACGPRKTAFWCSARKRKITKHKKLDLSELETEVG